MKRALNIVLLVCTSVVLGSCNKFSNGDTTTFPPRQLDAPFQIIEMRDDIDVVLKHSDAANPAGTVIITTGENLIDGISTEIEPVTSVTTHNGITDSIIFNKLVLRNNNTLGFLRPYDYTLEMTVYYDTLFELIFNSNGVVTTDTLRGYNHWTNFSSLNDTALNTVDSLTANLLIEIQGGSGNFTVLTNCFRLMTHYQHGTSDLTISGKVVRAETNGDYDSHGIIDGFDLEASSYHLVNGYGTNIIIAKAFNQIIARNENIGHIYYVRYSKPGKVIHWGHFENGHWIQNDTVDTLYWCPLNVTKRGAYMDSITSIRSRP